MSDPWLAERYELEAEFKRTHGYDWPNCEIADCENKSCVPFRRCYPHLPPAVQAEAMRMRESRKEREGCF